MLINVDGSNLGIMTREQAFFLAYDAGLDIVAVSRTTNPVVARLMDANKERYDQEKKARKQRIKQRSGEVKEIKLTFKISEHDFQTRLRHAERFIARGNQVKLTMRLIGRENAFVTLAKEKFTRFATELGLSLGDVTKQGPRLSTILRSA
ncbi:translation initiation factor IF-3 [Candidatus Berkelbacteria bacterium]|nr:translation initiation factor IF-3 [Candidatus Berkelbacteria bacterium]